jgi:hypothetical protein
LKETELDGKALLDKQDPVSIIITTIITIIIIIITTTITTIIIISVRIFHFQ